MVNKVRMLFLTLVAFSVMLAGNSQAGIGAGPQRIAPVGRGETAPDFTLEDQSGRKVSLSESRGNPVVIVFYRGYW
jgi:cytochrome oxidase Cu insertion factor (SCO1/SenC/PrrC family)